MVVKSFWIVIEQGYEYNDSTYDIGGSAHVRGQGFESKEEAEKEAKNRLKELLGGFRLCDFDEVYGYFNLKGQSEIIDEYMAFKGVEAQESYGRMYYRSVWDYRWTEFIEWCEDRTYNWTQYAPDLITTQEVKYDG